MFNITGAKLSRNQLPRFASCKLCYELIAVDAVLFLDVQRGRSTQLFLNGSVLKKS